METSGDWASLPFVMVLMLLDMKRQPIGRRHQTNWIVMPNELDSGTKLDTSTRVGNLDAPKGVERGLARPQAEAL